MPVQKFTNSKLVRTALAILKAEVPGVALDGEPVMVPRVGTFLGRPFVAACCFSHTVLFVRDVALLFHRDQGGMVPWYTNGDDTFPDLDYFKTGVTLTSDVVDGLVAEWMLEHPAISACSNASTV